MLALGVRARQQMMIPSDMRPIFTKSDDFASSCMFASCYHALTCKSQ